MESISVSNFRGFEKTDEIKIKPLTVLVGKNSSGKSSFLRLLPLLKQSIGRQHEGALIWYDPNGVDFNNMASTVMRGKKSIDFNLNFAKVSFRNFFSSRDRSSSTLKVAIRLVLDKNKSDVIKHISINLFGYSINISFKNSLPVEFKINKKKYHLSDKIGVSKSDSLLPRFVYYSGKSSEISFAHPYSIQKKVEDILFDNPKGRTISSHDLSKWMNWTPGNYKYLTKYLGIEEFTKTKKENALNLYILNNLNELMDAINRYIVFMARDITYIGPLRVMTERYNRETNHSIDEISSNGENLASLLSSLPQENFDKFKEWTQKNFEFTPHVTKRDGIIELAVSIPDSDECYNLSDLGVGYTQILPILVGIWQAEEDRSISVMTRSVYYEKEHIICIEQPELHIHPKMQKQFVQLIISILSNKASRNRFKFIIETHSQTIINAIGQAVRSMELPRHEVSILLFEKKRKEETVESIEETNTLKKKRKANKYFTKITVSDFDEKGYLSHWPYGFLS